MAGWRALGSWARGWQARGWALGWQALGWLVLGACLGGLLAGSAPAGAGGSASAAKLAAGKAAAAKPAAGKAARATAGRATAGLQRAGTASEGTTRTGITRTSTTPTGSACAAFRGAHQLPGADGVTPAAWSGAGLVVPACGPVPGEGSRAAPVYAYPGAQWTAGYQCVEFSQRYLYDRYGVSMNVLTNGDQVAAHYAADFPGLFMVVRNGTAHRAPRAGDVLSLSAAPGFDSASGGHTAVVQSSSVGASGNGTVTVAEENGSPSGIALLTVTAWTVRYPGFRYIEWLTATGPAIAADKRIS